MTANSCGCEVEWESRYVYACVDIVAWANVPAKNLYFLLAHLHVHACVLDWQQES